VFHPPQLSQPAKDSLEHLVKMKDKNGKIVHAYYLPADDANEKRTLVYSHGNACDIYQMYDYLRYMREILKINILHYEYTGYGPTRSTDCTFYLYTLSLVVCLF